MENLTHVARGYHVKLQRQGYTARCTIDNLYNISWKIAIEQTSVGLTHARPNWASTSSSEPSMWRLFWLQLLCHHCISSVQGLDYTKLSLRTLPCVRLLYPFSATSPTLPPSTCFFLNFSSLPCCCTPFTLLCFPIFVFIFFLCYSLHFALLLSSPPSYQ